MKRLLPYILFFFFVVGLTYVLYGGKISARLSSGNGTARSDVQDDDHIREATASGKLQSLGSVSIPGSGTHILVQKDKSTILLSALGVNLDPYVGKQVEIEGRVAKTASGKDLIQVLRLKELPPEATDDTTVSSKVWVPFEDISFGVKFLKRDFWRSTTAGTIVFTIPFDPTSCGVVCDLVKDDTITLEKIDNSKGVTLASLSGDPKLATRNLIGVKSLSGYKLSKPDGSIIATVASGKWVYRFTYVPGAFRSADAVANDFHSLLNSFEFLSAPSI